MPQDIKQYILEQRNKGIPDEQIYDSLKNKSEPAERGFLGKIIPTVTAIAGGIGGTALAPVAGSIGGAALGGVAGESLQQFIEEKFGNRKEQNFGQVAAAGVSSAATQALGLGIAAGVTKGAQSIISTLPPLKNGIIKVLKVTSGYAENVINKALERSPGTLATIKGGEKILNDIVQRSAGKISQFANNLLDESRKQVNKLATSISLGGPGQVASRNLILQEAKDFVSLVIKNLRISNIGAKKTGELIFGRLNRPSRIVAGSDKITIQEGFKWINSIKNNTSVKHIDAVLERLIVLKNKTPNGTPTGPETKALINNMIDEVMTFVQKTYPQYGSFLKDNLQKRITAVEMKDFFGGSAHLSPSEVSQISVRLLQLYNTGKMPIFNALEKISGKIGEDITGAAAGTLLNTGDQFSVRALKLTQRGLIEKVIEAIPRTLLLNYIKTGNFLGGLSQYPIIQTTAKTLGVSPTAVLQFANNLILETKER